MQLYITSITYITYSSYRTNKAYIAYNATPITIEGLDAKPPYVEF